MGVARAAVRPERRAGAKPKKKAPRPVGADANVIGRPRWRAPRPICRGAKPRSQRRAHNRPSRRRPSRHAPSVRAPLPPQRPASLTAFADRQIIAYDRSAALAAVDRSRELQSEVEYRQSDGSDGGSIEPLADDSPPRRRAKTSAPSASVSAEDLRRKGDQRDCATRRLAQN